MQDDSDLSPFGTWSEKFREADSVLPAALTTVWYIFTQFCWLVSVGTLF